MEGRLKGSKHQGFVPGRLIAHPVPQATVCVLTPSERRKSVVGTTVFDCSGAALWRAPVQGVENCTTGGLVTGAPTGGVKDGRMLQADASQGHKKPSNSAADFSAFCTLEQPESAFRQNI